MPELINQLRSTSLLEFIAVITGIVSVYFSTRSNIFVYPTGIVSVGIYAYLCYSTGLYADSALNIYYLIMSIYGYYYWLKKGEASQIAPVTHAQLKAWPYIVLSFIIAFVSITFFLKTFTNSNVYLLDSLATSAACVGMYLMARRKIEHWYFWILTNTISIPLFYSKGLVFTSFQFIVFLALSIIGLISWEKEIGVPRGTKQV